MIHTRRLLGAMVIAEWFGVDVRTITVWRSRGAERDRPFPAPDAEISTRVRDLYIPGWSPDREPEIRNWKTGMPGQGWRRATTSPDTPLIVAEVDTERFLGASDVAAWFGSMTRTVARWRARGDEYGVPFPAPDVEVSTHKPNVYIPGWSPSRESEIREWKSRMPGQDWRGVEKVGG